MTFERQLDFLVWQLLAVTSKERKKERNMFIWLWGLFVIVNQEANGWLKT